MSVFVQLVLVMVLLLYSASYLVLVSRLAERAAGKPVSPRPRFLAVTLALIALPVLLGLMVVVS